MELIWLILCLIGAFVSCLAIVVITFQGSMPIPVAVIISIFMTAVSCWLVSGIKDLPNVWYYFWR